MYLYVCSCFSIWEANLSGQGFLRVGLPFAWCPQRLRVGVGLWVGAGGGSWRGGGGWALPELEERRQGEAGTRSWGRGKSLEAPEDARDMQISRAEGSNR